MIRTIEIGKRLQELRKEKNLTQDELADMLMIDKRKISRFESGVITPDVDCLIGLSNIFNTSVDYLICNTDERTKYCSKNPIS